MNKVGKAFWSASDDMYQFYMCSNVAGSYINKCKTFQSFKKSLSVYFTLFNHTIMKTFFEKRKNILQRKQQQQLLDTTQLKNLDLRIRPSQIKELKIHLNTISFTIYNDYCFVRDFFN